MINIYNKDCLEAMKEMQDNQFDLAIVDPPYGLGKKTTSGGYCIRSGARTHGGAAPFAISAPNLSGSSEGSSRDLQPYTSGDGGASVGGEDGEQIRVHRSCSVPKTDAARPSRHSRQHTTPLGVPARRLCATGGSGTGSCHAATSVPT